MQVKGAKKKNDHINKLQKPKRGRTKCVQIINCNNYFDSGDKKILWVKLGGACFH